MTYEELRSQYPKGRRPATISTSVSHGARSHHMEWKFPQSRFQIEVDGMQSLRRSGLPEGLPGQRDLQTQ